LQLNKIKGRRDKAGKITKYIGIPIGIEEIIRRSLNKKE